MATPQQFAITQLYTALFNRAPDAAGLAFWDQAMSNGASIDTIAQNFLTAPEAVAIYPATAPTAQFVARFYATVFGREPDPEGLVFWAAALDAQGGAGNTAARAALVKQLVAIVSTPLDTKPAGISDEAYAQTVADRGRFLNKTDVGVYFATELKSDDYALAAKVLAAVTHEPESVTSARDVANGVPVGSPGGGNAGGGGGGGGGGVTPPAVPPVITRADTVDAISARLNAYSGSQATVNAEGMSDAQLIAVASNSTKIGTDGITNLAIELEGSKLSSFALQDLLKKTQAATVDVTGGAAFLPSISDLVSHIAEGGITGTVLLKNAVSSLQIPVLLGSKLSSAAEVHVDATFMPVDKLTVIANHIDKINVIDNLQVSIGDFYGTLSAEIVFSLLDKADKPTVNTINASIDDLHTLAERIIDGQSIALTGHLALEKGQFSLEEIEALLDSYAVGIVRISASGLSAADLVALSDRTDRINAFVDLSITIDESSMTDSVFEILLPKLLLGEVDVTNAPPARLLALVQEAKALRLTGDMVLNKSFIGDDLTRALWNYDGNTASVDVTGMTYQQMSTVTRELRKIGDAGITGDLTLNPIYDSINLTEILSKVSPAANLTLDAKGMWYTLLDIVAAHIDAVDSISNLSITNMRDSNWSVSTLAAVLPKATGAQLDASEASAQNVATILQNLKNVADGGLSKSIALDVGQFSTFKSLLADKLDANASVVIQGAAEESVVDLRDWSHKTQVISGQSADLIYAGQGADTVRIGSIAESRSSAFHATDLHADNIDQILGFAAGDLLSFSIAAGAYGDLRFSSFGMENTLTSLTYAAGADEDVSIQTVLDHLNSRSGVDAPVASKNFAASFYAVTITGGIGLSGTLLVLNDENATLDENDLIISVSGEITQDSLIFA